MSGKLERVKNLFQGVTWMQVGAGALAAATSLFLSSSIGIAGSIIGAAVGSVVTTLSSAVYKGFFTASDKAIKKKIGIEEETEGDAQASEGEGAQPLGAHAAQGPSAGDAGDVEPARNAADEPAPSYSTAAFTVAAREAGIRVDADKEAAADAQAAAAAVDTADDPGPALVEPPEPPATPAFEAADPNASAVADHGPARSPYGTVAAQPVPVATVLPGTDSASPYAQASAAAKALDPYAATAATAPAPSHLPDEVERVKVLAAQRRARRRERIVAAASLVTGLVAVALCAVIILGATGGNGIGHRTGTSAQQTQAEPDSLDAVDPAEDEEAADLAQDAVADQVPDDSLASEVPDAEAVDAAVPSESDPVPDAATDQSGEAESSADGGSSNEGSASDAVQQPETAAPETGGASAEDESADTASDGADSSDAESPDPSDGE